MTQDDMQEQPLDPVMERVRRKMIRLMVVSIGIMMVGLLAVLFAIIYKFGNLGEEREAASGVVPVEPFEFSLGLPSATKIISTDIRENRLVVDVEEDDGKRTLLLIDMETGRLISRININ